MRSGFKSGILLGGIAGATMLMVMNKDLDMDKAKRKMMRFYRQACKKSRKMLSEIRNMF